MPRSAPRRRRAFPSVPSEGSIAASNSCAADGNPPGELPSSEMRASRLESRLAPAPSALSPAYRPIFRRRFFWCTHAGSIHPIRFPAPEGVRHRSGRGETGRLYGGRCYVAGNNLHCVLSQAEWRGRVAPADQRRRCCARSRRDDGFCLAIYGRRTIGVLMTHRGRRARSDVKIREAVASRWPNRRELRRFRHAYQAIKRVGGIVLRAGTRGPDVRILAAKTGEALCRGSCASGAGS